MQSRTVNGLHTWRDKINGTPVVRVMEPIERSNTEDDNNENSYSVATFNDY
jgi:hypothetical protein